MCGIIGVVGDDNALTTILEGLHRLEYRGYDSAGVVLVGEGNLWRSRSAVGTQSVEALGKLTASAPTRFHTGIGHTRWATHGEPSEKNAHPHLDCTETIGVVHNGIIENHAELSQALRARGHEFHSETDTEVICHLVEEEMANTSDLSTALRRVLKQVEGSFAVAVVSANDSDSVVVGRRSAPLLVGIGHGVTLVGSDVSALYGHADDIVTLEDDQVGILTKNGLRVVDLQGQEVSPKHITLDPGWDLQAAQKGGFPDFMSKEMAEQPQAVRDTLLDRFDAQGRLSFDEIHIDPERLRRIDKVVIAACGSSYHAGLVAKYAIEQWARLPVEVDFASELRYREPVLHEGTLVVGVSQSGETLDTLEALREARREGAPTLVVANVVHSQMAREADGALYTRSGPEIGVASTKCHIAQMIALELLALMMAQWRGTLSASSVQEKVQAFHALPDLVAETLSRKKTVTKIATQLSEVRDFFYIGRHVGYPVALEGALKLKELSYLRAEGYPAGELKHGPIALIEEGTVVVAVLSSFLREKVLANVAEVQARGATVVLVAPDGDERAKDVADHVLWVPAVQDPLMSPVVDVVPLQLLAYDLAQIHGKDVDRPRNLAKTVTVE
jgi:glucosamine--fructose-6-phosphate aminotransferase (isomerizing)